MKDIEDMKIMWEELNERLSLLEVENQKLVQRIVKSDYKSTQDKLVYKYLAFIFLEGIMIVFMTLFFLFNPFINESFRIVSLVYWDVFFLIELILDLYLLIRIKNLNIYTASIKEVTKIAAQNWKIHKIAVICGLPLALGAVILFALACDCNMATIFGMLVGGLIGVLIGIRQLFKFRNYYNLLKTNEE